MSPVLAVEGLTVSFRGKIPAVSDVDLTVGGGEIVGLIGGSGAGKSTVARAVAGLVRPDHGSIRIAGSELLGARRAEVRRLRRMLHLVFRDPYASLPPTARVADIVAEPLAIHRVGNRGERADRAAEAVEAVGLPTALLRSFSHQLSGGERQRVAFARALVTRPRLILADEPTQMLDASLRRDMVDLIDELANDRRIAILHVTHDLGLAQHSCARLVVMCRGHVVESGPTAELLAAPRHGYTAALIAAAQHRPSKGLS
ncbi:MAG: ABC transporter ATP-binding protein [Pseudonocardia sp.]|nr:ABC transporter ATP-binding protein [Pseudonocardia sp.]